jgi:uncharacterized protein DUF5335
MPTIELPRETWVDRLNAFTMAHEGWMASLEVFGPETGQPPAVVTLPLIGVSADRVDHDGTIVISVARSAGQHLTRVIHDVARIYLEQPDDGSTAALLIESADGTRTTVHLRATPLRAQPSRVLDPPHERDDST